jgi:hypothetical protein
LIPDAIRRYLCTQLACPVDTPTEGAERTTYRYRQFVRAYLNIHPYAQGGAVVVESATRTAAYTMSDPADLINVAIEQLIHHRFELPAFSTLDRQVNHIRHEVHQVLYTRVVAQLKEEQRQALDELLAVPPGYRHTPFTRLKEAPGPATLRHLRRWEERLTYRRAQ